MSEFDFDELVLTTIDSDLADVDYYARRDVRLVRLVKGSKAVWLALRANGDFEVSDAFSVTASDEVSRYHRVQAYESVRNGQAVSIELAEQAAAEHDAAIAAAKAKHSKSKAKKVAA